MDFTTVKKSSTPQMVAEQILARIASGDLPTGARLPAQRDLAEQLGVGRSSVREAINALMVMGRLEVRQGSGTYVRSRMSAGEGNLQGLAAAFGMVGIMDLMEAREMLECHCARLAAERADAAGIRQLKRQMQQVEATFADYGIFLQADLKFHEMLAAATDNPVLVELTRVVLDKLTRQHRRLKTDRLTADYRQASIRSARNIVRAIEAGDGEEAARWMRVHLEAIRVELKDVIG
ncbi:MAG: FadR/GntR family transcriptional regulator [Desulfosarcinaceae bacterium]